MEEIEVELEVAGNDLEVEAVVVPAANQLNYDRVLHKKKFEAWVLEKYGPKINTKVVYKI